MKKTLISAIMLCLSVMAFAQITVGNRSEKIGSFNMGYYNLYSYISPTDTTYYMTLMSNNNAVGLMTVELGTADKAVALLQSLYDYEDDGGNRTIYLNNPTNHHAWVSSILGVQTYCIVEEHGSGDIYCYLTKQMIRKWLPKLKAYAGIK